MCNMLCDPNNLNSLKKWANDFVKSESKPPGTCKSKMNPTFHNVVVTARLNCKLNLRKIAYNSENVEYNPRKFSGVIMKIKKPRTTGLIYASGKIVCLGAKNTEDAHLAARKFARIVQRVGFTVKFSNFEVQNMVATYKVGFSLQLDNLAKALGSGALYNHEVCMSLVYKMTNPEVSMFILQSGSVIIFGAKTTNDVHEAFKNTFPFIREHAAKRKL